MERYVFEVACEMVGRGHEVSALCRSVDKAAVADSGVKVIMLHPKPAKRGWHDRYVFRDVVNEFLAAPGQRAAYDIIHSHENTVGQHVSTEHGPCTAQGLRLKPWKYFDYSARKNLAIETEKFRNPHLRALVSCSRRVQDIIIREYPLLNEKITQVITPAFTYLKPVARDPERSGRVLGFLGRDWKRKGLPKAIEIFRLLESNDPSWQMVIAGCQSDTLPRKLVGSLPDRVSVVGDINPEQFFAEIDVLVHPAINEPFGMVIPEAISCGVPVVFSDQCGAADHLRADGLVVLPVASPAREWAQACSKVANQVPEPLTLRTWADVAAAHEDLYNKLRFD